MSEEASIPDAAAPGRGALLLMAGAMGLVLAATIGLDPVSVGRVRMRLTEGLVGLVAEELEPQVVVDATVHPRFKYFPEAREDAYHSFLGVPMLDRGLLVGVLVVQTIAARAFSRDDVRMLTTAASQLAPIVSDARTAHEAQLQGERLHVVQVTMRTVHGIVNTFLTQLQMFQLDAEGVVPEASVAMLEAAIRETSAKLKALGEMEVFAEKDLGSGPGLDVKEARK